MVQCGPQLTKGCPPLIYRKETEGRRRKKGMNLKKAIERKQKKGMNLKEGNRKK